MTSLHVKEENKVDLLLGKLLAYLFCIEEIATHSRITTQLVLMLAMNCNNDK